MKKIFIPLIISLILIPTVVKANTLDITPNASKAILMDYDTGEILYEKNKDKKTSIASLTKMMGLILIFEKIENGSLKQDEILTTSKNAKEMGGTQIWLEEGEKISVKDLIKGITMASANDAMVLMAERVSGTEQEFVKEMNKKAKELNLKNTNFINSTGLDEEGNYSTAYDTAIIAKELIKHKKVLNYTKEYESYIRENTDNKTWIVNTNKLVKFYKGVDGLKTGYTEQAGSSLAVTAKQNGLRLIAISLGYNNTKTRNSETIAMLDYGFHQYESKTLIEKTKKIKEIKLDKSNINKVNLFLKDDLTITTKKGEFKKKYTYNIKLNKLSYPVKKGDTIGYLYLKEQTTNKTIKKVSLITDQNIEKASILKQYIRVIKNFLTGEAN